MKVLFNDPEQLKSKMLIKGNILLIVSFQGDHQPVLFGISNHLIQQNSRYSVMLHAGPYSQIDHMEPFRLMKLIRPSGIQIISSLDKIPEGF